MVLVPTFNEKIHDASDREVPGLSGVGPGPSPMEYYYPRDTHGVAVRVAYAIRRLRWLSLAYPKY